MKTISVCFVAILFACWATAADYHEDILGNVSGNSAEDKFVQVTSVPLKVQERVIEFTVKVSILPRISAIRRNKSVKLAINRIDLLRKQNPMMVK